jgi:hypothetical protein
MSSANEHFKDLTLYEETDISYYGLDCRKIYKPIASYIITSNVNDINEPNNGISMQGRIVTYTILTSGVSDGTVLYWTNDGSTQSDDFEGKENSGSVMIVNGAGVITRTLTKDFTTEGEETIIIQLRTGSLSGNVVAIADTVTVFDASNS